MHKTSVYLPEPLKADLTALAAATRRSEAELIRRAIEELVAEHRRADRDRRAMSPARLAGPCLVGVGVGPGAAELLTGQALDVLAGADRIFVAAAATDAVSRAETVVRSAVPDRRIERLPIAVFGPDDDRSSSFDAAAETVGAVVARGESAALAVLGDPNVFSSFAELARRVRARHPAIPIRTVPGIMAFQQVAARAAITLAESGDLLCLGTGDDVDRLAAAAQDPATTVVLYKGGRHVPALAAELDRLDRLGSAMLGELLDRPGERCQPVADHPDEPASYLATVVAPAQRAHR